MITPSTLSAATILIILLLTSCKTPPEPASENTGPATGTFTDPRDGQTYPWVRIGSQVWMAENLRYLPEVARQVSSSATRPFYYVYGYDGTSVSEAKSTANYQNYGVLYNWPAAMAGASSSRSNPSSVQGVCPPGWHLPSDAEWNELINYVKTQGFPNENEPKGAGNALKSCRQVRSPLGDDCATSQHPRWRSNDNHHGFDEFGFSALPGGYRRPDGRFVNLNRFGYWWSSTEYDAPTAWIRFMRAEHGHVRHDHRYHKSNAFSVRCVKN